MSTWTEVFTFARNWLTEIWNGIFGVEIFDGLTGKVIILGILVVFFSITIFRFFISNTHAELGTTTTTDTVSYNHGTGRATYVTTTSRRRRH